MWQIGAPVVVKKKGHRKDITAADVDNVHNEFMNAMRRLFARTKEKYGVAKSIELDIC